MYISPSTLCSRLVELQGLCHLRRALFYCIVVECEIVNLFHIYFFHHFGRCGTAATTITTTTTNCRLLQCGHSLPYGYGNNVNIVMIRYSEVSYLQIKRYYYIHSRPCHYYYYYYHCCLASYFHYSPIYPRALALSFCSLQPHAPPDLPALDHCFTITCPASSCLSDVTHLSRLLHTLPSISSAVLDFSQSSLASPSSSSTTSQSQLSSNGRTFSAFVLPLISLIVFSCNQLHLFLSALGSDIFCVSAESFVISCTAHSTFRTVLLPCGTTALATLSRLEQSNYRPAFSYPRAQSVLEHPLLNP